MAGSTQIQSQSADGRLARILTQLGFCHSGAVAIEFALISPVLLIMFLNMTDFSVRIWSQMQLDNAAEIGAQAAYATCAGITAPVTTNCSSMNSAIMTGIQSTSLGMNVKLASGSPTEAYYCTNTTGNTLKSVGTPSSPPSPFDCSATGNSSATPGDYITVNVNYVYNPILPGLSLLSSSTLSGAGVMRLR